MSATFNLNKYGQAVESVLTPEPLPVLGPGLKNRTMHEPLRQMTVATLFAGQRVVDPQMAQCCLSALWLVHDFLDEGHEICQSIKTPEGSYWHGIMHRREPDYSNAKYWFRNVGEHSIFPDLAAGAAAIAAESALDTPAEFLSELASWDPYRFIDLCRSIAVERSNAVEPCRLIAQLEWRLLFDYCWQHAVA